MHDEDKTVCGFFVLDLRIWWRQVHTLYCLWRLLGCYLSRPRTVVLFKLVPNMTTELYVIILLISIDLPSPPQLLRTCVLTLVSGLTDASCAPVDLQTALRLPNTCGLTQARSHTSARYVSWSFHSRGIWIDTCACTNTAACEWLRSSVIKSRAW